MALKIRHKVFLEIVRPFVRLFFKLRYGFKVTSHYDLPKQFLVISNHVTQVDPLILSSCLRNPIYYVASEIIFRHKYLTPLLKFFFDPIQKKKNEKDLVTIIKMLEVSKKGCCLGLFLSGNTTYSGDEEYIDSPIARLVKLLGLPIVLHNFKGAYGVAPRWGNTLRKGKFYSEIARVITKDEYMKMSDEELEEAIKKGISVKANDGVESEEYDCKSRAEYLERALFVCPDCHKLMTMVSNGNNFKCNACGYEVTYQKDMTFNLLKGKKKFKNVKEWYDFEKDYISNYDFSKIKGEIIHDDEVRIYDLDKKEKSSSKLSLFNDRVELSNEQIMFADITSLSAQGKHSLLIKTNDLYYQLDGEARFSSLIYVFIYYSIKNKKEGIKNGFLGI